MPAKLRPSSPRLVAVIGGACLLVAAAYAVADPGSWLRNLREVGFDRLLALSPRADTAQSVMVVDIGRDALAAIGAWPWPRQRLASLVDKIAESKPRAFAVDMLLVSRQPDPDDDKLAAALGRLPSVLGVVLDPEPTRTRQMTSSIAVTGDVRVPELLVTAGAIGPGPALLANAQGVGVISLPAPEGEPVRAVPLIAGGAETLFPGLAIETLRVAHGGGTLIASSPPQELRVGDIVLPLPPDGLMRLQFSDEASRVAHTIPAQALLDGSADLSRLTGKIVLLGASAPEAGGLRFTAVNAFMPSVEIQAEAIEQMLSERIPWRGPFMNWFEILAGICLGALSIVAVIFLSPGRAALAVLGLIVVWVAATIDLGIGPLLLVDSVVPTILTLIALQAATLAQFALTYRQRLAIERRFALHVPPEVVRRIVENPSDLRLVGESRIITVLLTDIEGFTALTERAGPESVVALLDRYIDLVAGIVVDHGGMVDKIVGDGVHAFFNAPLDLPDHAEKAVACALAIITATQALRNEPAIAPLGMGRTRIGIETGPAILGDVGRGAKRDYTAYGRPVNFAARLQGANKHFGSSIAIGPGSVAALAGRIPLRRLGEIPLSGIDEKIEVFEPAGALRNQSMDTKGL